MSEIDPGAPLEIIEPTRLGITHLPYVARLDPPVCHLHCTRIEEHEDRPGGDAARKPFAAVRTLGEHARKPRGDGVERRDSDERRHPLSERWFGYEASCSSRPWYTSRRNRSRSCCVACPLTSSDNPRIASGSGSGSASSS